MTKQKEFALPACCIAARKISRHVLGPGGQVAGARQRTTRAAAARNRHADARARRAAEACPRYGGRPGSAWLAAAPAAGWAAAARAGAIWFAASVLVSGRLKTIHSGIPTVAANIAVASGMFIQNQFISCLHRSR